MGKAIFVLFLSCFGMLLPAALNGAERVEKSDFTITEIRFDFRNTPMFTYQDINDTYSNAARTKWAVMTLAFVPSAAGTRTGWYDDITMEATTIMTTNSEVTSGDSGKGSTVYAVFTGKTRFFTIQADGKHHVGVFYIPAKLLDRFYPKSKNFNPSMFTAAKVEFYTKGRILLGEGYWTSNGSSKKTAPSPKLRADFADFDRRFPNSLKLPGGLYSKEKTPWAFFNYDFYDLIYEDGILGDAKGTESAGQ